MNLNLKTLEQEVIKLNDEINYLKNKKPKIREVINKF